MKEKVKVVLFSGGRGTENISKTFLKYPHIDLSVVVNAYDDGLSTGRLRKFIPGMLGPSDVRKNITYLMPDNEKCFQSLKKTIEFRFPEDISYVDAMNNLRAISNTGSPPEIKELAEAHENISLKYLKTIRKYCHIFLDYTIKRQKEGDEFDFGDVAVGNILFTGCYLNESRDFNKATEMFSRFCETKAKVLNVTNGENFILMALKNDGSILKRESEIVSNQNKANISDIFLMKDYLDEAELREAQKLSYDELYVFLKEKECFPEISMEANRAIKEADIIIYGPGTQYSSLFPSYLTKGLAETVIENRNAEKIFISNIVKDHDIQSETVNSLVDRLIYYMSRKGEINIEGTDIITSFFIQGGIDVMEAPSSYVEFNKESFDYSMDKVTIKDWERQKGKHHGGMILEELVSVVERNLQKRFQPFNHLVSIIVPGLNEENTVGDVLHKLKLLDLQKLDIGKEIIFVDGGSIDKTYEVANSEKGVKVFRLSSGGGRGDAFRLGIEKARGDIIVFFPSDGEYSPEDIYVVIDPIIKGSFNFVFGNRATKVLKFDHNIKKIYRNNPLLYFFSKYGGIMLSAASLFLYNRYIIDPLTTLKAFQAKSLKNLQLESSGVDLEAEIIAKACKTSQYILEVPVDHKPRTRKQGKKMSIFDGLKVLFALFKYKLREINANAKSFNHHSCL